MPGKWMQTFADFGGEKSTLTVRIATQTAANIAATTALLATLATATDAITNGLVVKEQLIASSTGSGSGKSTNEQAQREHKWLVTYQDSVSLELFHLEVPTALLSVATMANSVKDTVSLGETVWSDWVDAFEAVARSKNGATVTVFEITYVGRNI